jgi:hypothetical protein
MRNGRGGKGIEKGKNWWGKKRRIEENGKGRGGKENEEEGERKGVKGNDKK